MDNGQLVLQVHLLLSNYLKFNKKHVSFFKNRTIWGLSIIPLLLVLSSTSSAILSCSLELFELKDFIPLLILIAIILFFYLSFIYKIKSIYKNTPSINQPFELQFSDSGILVKHINSETKYNWNNFVFYSISDEEICIYFSKNKAIIIPRRDIKSNSDYLILKDLLEVYILR